MAQGDPRDHGFEKGSFMLQDIVANKQCLDISEAPQTQEKYCIKWRPVDR
jgi:hypothetical protein